MGRRRSLIDFFPSPPNLNEQCSLSLCLFVSLTNKKNVSAPQREVLFVSLTFSLSPQPQRAVLVVSLSICLFVSLTNKKKCVSPSKRSSLCLFDFFPLPPTSTSSARCLFVSLSHCLFDK